MYIWSAKNNGFYPCAERERFEKLGLWPDDGVDITDQEHDTLFAVIPENKRLGTTDGKPAWVDIPPLTQDERVAAADAEQQRCIEEANEYINRRQWPGKAAIGRLKIDELTQYNLWLDYLDALEAIDTTSTPDIEWPTPPASAEG